MKVWKVVLRRNGDLTSLIPLPSDGPIFIKYKPGEWACGKVGPIFAFEDLISAKKFRQRLKPEIDCEIWEAEAENVQPQRFCLSGLDLTARSVEMFWRSDWPFRKNYTPEGTVVCDRIKLLKKVV